MDHSDELKEDNEKLVKEINEQKKVLEEIIKEKESIIYSNACENVKLREQYDNNIRDTQDNFEEVKKEAERVNNLLDVKTGSIFELRTRIRDLEINLESSNKNLKKILN